MQYIDFIAHDFPPYRHIYEKWHFNFFISAKSTAEDRHHYDLYADCKCIPIIYEVVGKDQLMMM